MRQRKIHKPVQWNFRNEDMTGNRSPKDEPVIFDLWHFQEHATPTLYAYSGPWPTRGERSPPNGFAQVMSCRCLSCCHLPGGVLGVEKYGRITWASIRELRRELCQTKRHRSSALGISCMSLLAL